MTATTDELVKNRTVELVIGGMTCASCPPGSRRS